VQLAAQGLIGTAGVPPPTAIHQMIGQSANAAGIIEWGSS
jgi:hypothetical protein